MERGEERPQQMMPLDWMLGSEDMVMRYEHFLRGEVLEKQGDKLVWMKKGYELMDEPGIKKFMAIVSQHTGKEIHLSKLDQDNINQICYKVHEVCREQLLLNHNQFKAKKEDFDIIIQCTVNVVRFSLQRSEGGFNTDFIRDTLSGRYIQTFQAGESQMENKAKKLGLIDRIFRREN